MSTHCDWENHRFGQMCDLILVDINPMWPKLHYNLKRLSQLSLNVRKRTFWHVRPKKTQTSPRIRSVRPVFFARMKIFAPLAIQNRPVKIQIRLRECAVWYESLLGVFVGRYIFWFFLLNKIEWHNSILFRLWAPLSFNDMSNNFNFILCETKVWASAMWY